MPARRRNAVDLVQLQPGDLVVHEQHGIGRYIEMISRTVNGGQRDYLIVEYAASRRNQPPDRLFVPTDSLDQLTRYVGGEAPALSKLGGADWKNTKSKARKAVKQIAGELIRLYSARMASKGHAFGPDTVWQRELEDAFPFQETPDQLAAIDEVKADMQQSVPMDRIICGDVGYGKTEIAIRAAFKAVQDGKQVAVLVPTTLLANQHFKTFSERVAQFPVTVKVLSRFQSEKETTEILRQLAAGEIDILVGTHRLLQPTTRWKDLGLVIVDEEQRFGVEHKEYLKTMRTAVDVLSMSATPIPRTLEMSLTGIREMSTILTPPEERHPVLTYVGAWADKQMAAAIRRELLRDGQVFVIHNRVQSIDKAAAKIRSLVPEARVAVGHGQMKEHELERIMVGFWEKEYDVLVATTIVESGLDIPNANTLIVDRADTFGLSQLHQIRGRVGRGRERAYAYFTYDPTRTLTETSVDRLTTIANNTDLGAGMAVAMKDLEIRGSGNLLGGEQSGHIAGVGFDLYVRLVGEAVADYRSQVTGEEAPAEPVEVRVDLPIDAHLPHDYVPGERLRMEAYRKVASHPGRGPGAGGARRAHRPVRRTAGPGAQPARRRPVPGGDAGARHHRGVAAGPRHPDQPGRAAGVQADAAGPARRGRLVQGRGGDDRAEDAGRPRPADAAARRRAAGEPAGHADRRPRPARGGGRLLTAAGRPGVGVSGRADASRSPGRGHRDAARPRPARAWPRAGPRRTSPRTSARSQVTVAELEDGGRRRRATTTSRGSPRGTRPATPGRCSPRSSSAEVYDAAAEHFGVSVDDAGLREPHRRAARGAGPRRRLRRAGAQQGVSREDAPRTSASSAAGGDRRRGGAGRGADEASLRAQYEQVARSPRGWSSASSPCPTRPTAEARASRRCTADPAGYAGGRRRVPGPVDAAGARPRRLDELAASWPTSRGAHPPGGGVRRSRSRRAGGVVVGFVAGEVTRRSRRSARSWRRGARPGRRTQVDGSARRGPGRPRRRR